MKRLALLRNELPRIALRRKRQLQPSVSADILHFAVRQSKSQEAMTAPSSAHHNLPNPMSRIGPSIWVLRSQSLVRVLVPRKNDVRMHRVQIFPQRLQLGMDRVAPENAAAEQRVMPIRHD